MIEQVNAQGLKSVESNCLPKEDKDIAYLQLKLLLKSILFEQFIKQGTAAVKPLLYISSYRALENGDGESAQTITGFLSGHHFPNQQMCSRADQMRL